MKIGYVGSAFSSISCKPDRGFQLKSYSKEKLYSIVDSNLQCILKTLKFNLKNKITFYRIADFIPFASHPTSLPLESIFQDFSPLIKEIALFILRNEFRISMHPGQYTILNSPKNDIVEKAIKELEYDTMFMDFMGLNLDAKVQVHVGGVYGNKKKSINRFIKNFHLLPENIKSRIAIENDDVSYDLKDCLIINQETGIPVIFDVFHHSIKNRGETLIEGIKRSIKTWKDHDGKLMLDWSSQEPEMKIGRHADTLNEIEFEEFITRTMESDFDILLEVRDKERSAIKAVQILEKYGRI